MSQDELADHAAHKILSNAKVHRVHKIFPEQSNIIARDAGKRALVDFAAHETLMRHDRQAPQGIFRVVAIVEVLASASSKWLDSKAKLTDLRRFVISGQPV